MGQHTSTKASSHGQRGPGTGTIAATPLPVPVFQTLAAVRGTLAELPDALQSIAANASAERPAWLEVTVVEDDYLADLAPRIQAMAEGLPLQVLRIKRQRGTAAPQLLAEASESLDELSPQDVFARRMALETLEPPLQEALTARYRQVLDSLSNAPGDAA